MLRNRHTVLQSEIEQGLTGDSYFITFGDEAELRAQLRLSEPEHIVLRALSQPLAYQAALN